MWKNRELFGYYKIKTQKYNVLCSGKLTGVVLHTCGKLYGKKVKKALAFCEKIS